MSALLDRIVLTKEPLDIQTAYSQVTGLGYGGVSLFIGNVREMEEGEKIAAIEYDAYASMAKKEIEKLIRKSENEFEARIAVHHRLGQVETGGTSVIVAAATAHRSESFTACRTVIDQLKKIVPIWKVSFSTGVK